MPSQLPSWPGRGLALGLCALFATIGLTLFVSSRALADETAVAPKPSSEGDEPVRSSPRAAVQRFLDLTRAGNYHEAGALLELSASREAQRERLTRRLKAVLDRRLWIDIDKVSDSPGGALNDGLSPELEELGKLRGSDGELESVRLRLHGPAAQWRFSSGTVGRVDAWYESLDDRWLLEHLPAWLLRRGPRDLLWWQWLGLLLSASVAVGLASAGSSVARALARRAASRTQTLWDDRLIERSAGPLTLACWIGLMKAALPWLLLYAPAEQLINQVLRGLLLATFLWVVWRMVDLSAELSLNAKWSHEHPGSRALIPLARRAGKAVVGVVAALVFLATLGYPVASLLAGLGIGGLALALASQKTVENLFGAFSLGIDQPFREGDFVRIEELVGTVESLGLRSTKIRTLDRTLVSIPNGKLAEMRLESFAARDRLRLACTVGLVYDTSEDQMREVLAGLEQALRSHPKIWPEVVVVRFKELAASSLDIEVMAWFATSDWGEFQGIRQEVLLAFMGVVERAGTSFAFPTQTLHLIRAGHGGGEGRRRDSGENTLTSK